MLTDTVSKICVAAIIIAALIVVGALAWHGTLTGAQTLGVITAIIGIPAALFVHTSTVNAAARRP